jgi:hypothetical protein
MAHRAQAKVPLELVIVVTDAAEIERRLQEFGVPFEGTFTAAVDDARRARRDLARFVRAELKTADRRRAVRLRRILANERSYLWHCAGFERSGSRYLHCSFVRYSEGDHQLREPRFPQIDDGGTDVCRCVFSPKTGQIATLAWNGEG